MTQTTTPAPPFQVVSSGRMDEYYVREAATGSLIGPFVGRQAANQALVSMWSFHGNSRLTQHARNHPPAEPAPAPAPAEPSTPAPTPTPRYLVVARDSGRLAILDQGTGRVIDHPDLRQEHVAAYCAFLNGEAPTAEPEDAGFDPVGDITTVERESRGNRLRAEASKAAKWLRQGGSS